MKQLIPILAILICLASGCTKKSLSSMIPPTRDESMSLYKSTGSTPGAFNGFVVNGAQYDARYMGRTHADHPQFWFQSDVEEGATLTFNTKDPIPNADGVYSFTPSGDLSQPGNIQIACVLNSTRQKFEVFNPSGSIVIIKVAGPFVSITVPELQLESMDGPLNAITVSATLSYSVPLAPVRTTKPSVIVQ
jgi:hypothetical protein